MDGDSLYVRLELLGSGLIYQIQAGYHQNPRLWIQRFERERMRMRIRRSWEGER